MDEYLGPWDFTTSRTYYSPGSEHQWYRLLQNMTNAAKHELSEHASATQDLNTTPKLENVFSLDPCSNPETLNGWTMDEVRQVYRDETGVKPMNADLNIFRLFILAEAEVLADPELSFIKYEGADYEPTAPRRSYDKLVPSRYFGWIRMSSLRILSFWFEQDTDFFGENYNFTSDGTGGSWTADNDR